MKKTIIYLLFLHAWISGTAQNVEPENIVAIVSNNELTLSFTIPGTRGIVKNSHCLLIRPVLSDGVHRRELPSATIAGKQWLRRLRQKRLLAGMKAVQPGDIMSRTGEPLLYTMGIPYESWMEKATLRLFANEKGCCSDKEESSSEYPFTVIQSGAREYVIAPLPLITLPEKEIEERYSFILPEGAEFSPERGSISVHFPVSDIRLNRQYASNEETLSRVDSAIVALQQMSLPISRVTIEGFASPEGNQEQNKLLAEKRAKALQDYIAQKHTLPDSRFETRAGGENWKELRELIASSTLSYRDEILRVIDHTPEAERNAALKQLKNGRPYLVLLDQYYPRLRNACYIHVYYTPVVDSARVAINRAIGYINQQAYQEACSLLQQYAEDRRAFTPLGISLFMLGEKDAAKEYLLKAVADGNDQAKRYITIFNLK